MRSAATSHCGRAAGQGSFLGENFPEGTSQSDPSAVPRRDQPEDESPRRQDEEAAISPSGRDDPAEETDAEEAPESQQAG